MARPFLTIKTKDGTPLRRDTPIDPEQYQRDVKTPEDRGLRPPPSFKDSNRRDSHLPTTEPTDNL